MWWCCGKPTQTAPGCKFSKHESKEDEEDEMDQGHAEQMKKNVRCMCCKELGHRVTECPKDPNLKTSKSAEEENDRVVRIREYRKLCSDNIFITTQILSRCML